MIDIAQRLRDSSIRSQCAYAQRVCTHHDCNLDTLTICSKWCRRSTCVGVVYANRPRRKLPPRTHETGQQLDRLDALDKSLNALGHESTSTYSYMWSCATLDDGLSVRVNSHTHAKPQMLLPRLRIAPRLHGHGSRNRVCAQERHYQRQVVGVVRVTGLHWPLSVPRKVL